MDRLGPEWHEILRKVVLKVDLGPEWRQI